MKKKSGARRRPGAGDAGLVRGGEIGLNHGGLAPDRRQRRL